MKEKEKEKQKKMRRRRRRMKKKKKNKKDNFKTKKHLQKDIYRQEWNSSSVP